LREGLKELCAKNGWESFIPKMEYCTDNAAMIAIAGYYKYMVVVAIAYMYWKTGGE
jgi:N6-L-threonylcarbamoyladenine synthase